MLTVGLNRAVTLIAEKKLNPGKGRRFGADPGRPLGDHPDKGGPVVVKKGRYGPYVSHDGVNATLPSDMTPETVTLEQALPLLDARAARGTGTRKKKPAKPTKAAAKKAAPAEQPDGRGCQGEEPEESQGRKERRRPRRLPRPRKQSPPGPKAVMAAGSDWRFHCRVLSFLFVTPDAGRH